MLNHISSLKLSLEMNESGPRSVFAEIHGIKILPALAGWYLAAYNTVTW